MVFTSIISTVLCGTFIGCGSSIPNCNDEEVRNTLATIIQDNLDSMQIVRKDDENIHYEYSSFMTEKADEQTKKITCKAQVTIKDKRHPE